MSNNYFVPAKVVPMRRKSIDSRWQHERERLAVITRHHPPGTACARPAAGDDADLLPTQRLRIQAQHFSDLFQLGGSAFPFFRHLCANLKLQFFGAPRRRSAHSAWKPYKKAKLKSKTSELCRLCVSVVNILRTPGRCGADAFCRHPSLAPV